MSEVGTSGFVRVSARAFLALEGAGGVVDVRSPSEFAQGHIPGAVNVPLFSDAARAEVGTIYAKRGHEAAVARGIALVAPRLEDLRREILKAARYSALRLHCWRGGLRSESVAWLVGQMGYRVYLLEGGYKAYRREVLDSFAEPRRLLVLAGMTGSAKSEVLRELDSRGEAVVDLEQLAHHKGSAFGALGETPQPTTEMFENNLHAQLLQFPPYRPVWLEDESRNIGRVVLPGGLFAAMESAPRVVLQMPEARRVERLMAEYAGFPVDELAGCIAKISRRLGGARAVECVEQVRTGDLRGAVQGVLSYYDKQYSHQLQTHHGEYVVVQCGALGVAEIADAVLEASGIESLH